MNTTFSKLSQVRTFFNSYSEIFFVRNSLVGVLFFLVTMMHPHVGLAGALSLIVAYAFAAYLQCNKTFLTTGVYTYNALLVGLSIGYVFHFSLMTVGLIILASILTLIISLALNTFLNYNCGLPILSLPFVIVSSILYLATIQYGNLTVGNLYAHHFSTYGLSLPIWLQGYFVSMGSVFFSPYLLPGICITVAVALCSRIVFFYLSLDLLLGQA